MTLSGLVCVLAASALVACGGDVEIGSTGADYGDVGSFGARAFGGGSSSTCNGGAPDGFCNAAGPNAEDCTCADCAHLGKCTGACANDGRCHMPASDDCSCADCFWKVAACSPRHGCSGAATCNNTVDDCVCAACTTTDFCKKNCVNDGICNRWTEGCSCADCAREPECGGGGAPDAGSDAKVADAKGGS